MFFHSTIYIITLPFPTFLPPILLKIINQPNKQANLVLQVSTAVLVLDIFLLLYKIEFLSKQNTKTSYFTFSILEFLIIISVKLANNSDI